MKQIFSLLVMFCLVIGAANAQTYDVDRSWGTRCGVSPFSTIGGYSVSNDNPSCGGCRRAEPRATILNPDGSVFSVYQLSTEGRFVLGIVKLDVNGQPVASFGSGGSLSFIAPEGTDNHVRGADTGANGKLFVVGAWGDGCCTGGAWIGCFNANGSLNYSTALPNDGRRSAYLGVVVQADGKAVVWGASRIPGTLEPNFIARRFNTNGTLDNSFGGNFPVPNNPASIDGARLGRGIIQSDGRAVFAYMTNPRAGDAYLELYLTRLNLNGTIDNTFGNGGFNNTVFSGGCHAGMSGSEPVSLVKIAGDKMRVSGHIINNCPNGNSIDKLGQFTANGLHDNTWGVNGSFYFPMGGGHTIRDIAVDPITDKTYATGVYFQGGVIYRLNSNGTLDNSFDGDGQLGPFNDFNVGKFNDDGFSKIGLYSGSRMFVNFMHGNDPNMRGVVHTVIDFKDAQLTIAQAPSCPNVQLTLAEANPSCYSLQWYKNGIAISGATGSSYTATTDGNYLVKGSYGPVPPGPPGLTPGTTTSNTLNVVVPPPTWYLDADLDQYYAGSPVTQCASPGDGWTQGPLIAGGDCEDANAAVNPGATEVCNTIDDDCDGSIDEGVQSTFYADADGDGFGDNASPILACTAPNGYGLDNTDCDDDNYDANPSAAETCNGIDDNCNGTIDEGVKSTFYADTDGDGYGDNASSILACTVPNGYASNNTDCNDSRADANPAAAEVCDGIDNDCDGGIDEGVKSTFYRDADGDTYGNANNSIEACYAPNGYVTDNTDCNDNAAAGGAAINPGAAEVCNGKDDDCDGAIDEGVKTTFYADSDGDGFGDVGNSVEACSQPSGYTTDASDCDDSHLLYTDVDGDGYGAGDATGCGVADNTDCDDATASTNPGAAEVCADGIDNNCDGAIDEGCNTCNISVDAGADVSTFFGYSVTQTANRTATVTGGTGTITYTWSLSRALACNVITASGDESFTGGTCTNNACGGTPSCSGASISAALLSDAVVCVTVTDANGCTATDCFNIDAEDARCFAGNSGNQKVTVCHRTNSNSNPWVQICIAEAAVPAHLSEHETDYIGKCVRSSAKNDEEFIDEVITEDIQFKAYPNPFTDKLNVEFSLTSDSKAKLEVLNVAGQVLAVLFEGEVKAAERNVYEYKSSNVARGMVIYRLQTEEGTFFGKAVMMK